MIHVCSLARLHETVAETGARHVVTLMKDVALVRRPHSILATNHLLLDMDDITAEIEGFVAPCEDHVSQLIAFVEDWDRAKPLVVHCYAGISRSTAGAFIAACVLNPQRNETLIANAIRDASVIANPNMRLIALADRLLERKGRMLRAIEAIGPGQAAPEGNPFRLDLE